MVTSTPIPPLPQAPSRSDGQAAFNLYADPFIAAMPPMVVNINTRLEWIATQVSATEGYKNAAAISAGAAADSATAANASKIAAAQSAIDATNNGAAQVTLAANQVALAVSAKNSAEAAAAAAGSAAGLPSLVGNAYKVLRVNTGATGVEWGLGLPPVAGVTVGKSLVVGAGNSVAWEFAGQQIGDVLVSARNPGALYVPANGAIRLKSAYPELSALVGTINGVIGANWSNVPMTGTLGSTGMAASTSGTVIVSGAGVVYRSIDRGLTFGEPISLPIGFYLVSLSTDGNGNWIGLSSANASASQTCVFSSNDGLSWTQASMPSLPAGGYSYSRVRYVGSNSWVAISNQSSITTLVRSTNGGATWTALTHGLTTVLGIAASGNGTVLLAGAVSSTNRIARSADFGATWALGATWTGGSARAIETDKAGTWFIGCGGNASGNFFRSLDDGLTVMQYPVFVAPSTSTVNIVFYTAGKLIIGTSGTPSGISSYDLATQVLSSIASGSIVVAANPGVEINDAGLGVLISYSNTVNNLARSTPQFPYDTATQFALPNVTAVAGTAAYIKAKEA
jgi:hypothetical protein